MTPVDARRVAAHIHTLCEREAAEERRVAAWVADAVQLAPLRRGTRGDSMSRGDFVRTWILVVVVLWGAISLVAMLAGHYEPFIGGGLAVAFLTGGYLYSRVG